MSQCIAQQWMKRSGGGGGRSGGVGAVTEFPSFLAAGQGDHRTQQARRTRRCSGRVSPCLCVHIWINYCFPKTGVGVGKAVGQQFRGNCSLLIGEMTNLLSSGHVMR